MKKIIPLYILISLSSCIQKKVNNSYTNKNLAEINTIEKTVQDNQDFIDTLYVTAKDGLEIRNKPSIESSLLGVLPYGKKVHLINMDKEIIHEKKFVSIYEYIPNDNTYEHRVVYVDSEYLGQIEEIKLSKDLLCETYFYNTTDENNFEDECVDKSILKFNLVAENKVNQKTILSKIPDTTYITKVDGTLTIPLQKSNNNLIFKDVLKDNDNYREYKYYGYSEPLNKHLIYEAFYEGGEFFFVDKVNGKEKISFIGYPFISPNNEIIVTFNANPYENSGELEIFKITSKNKIEKLFSGNFKNWMPLDQDNILSIDNNNVIIKVLYSKVFWNKDGNLNSKNFQLLKLSWKLNLN